MGNLSYRLSRAVNALHRASARSKFVTWSAVKIRNQCDAIIGYALGDDAEVTDSGNSERWLVDLVGPSIGNFIDVGANIGDWTDALLSTNPNVAGVLCEPVDWCYQKLCDRFRGRNTLVLLQTAVGRNRGHAAFTVAPGNAKTSSFALSKPNDTSIVEVAVTTIDDLMRAHRFETLDLLKIDCEGFDLQVLLGAEAHLESQRIGLIQFEYNSAWPQAGGTLGFTLNFLAGFGYSVFLLRRRQLINFDYSTWGEFARYSNFVAVPYESAMYRTLLNTSASD